MGKGIPDQKIPSAQKVAKSLRMSGQNSHSDDTADMSISDADVKLSIISSLNEQVAHQNKVNKLKSNGWDGKTCIDCHHKIPPDRLEAMPECCRCLACQSKSELQTPPKKRMRR